MTQEANQPAEICSGESVAVALKKMRVLIERGFATRKIDQDGKLDARMLLMHGTGLSHTDLISKPTQPVSKRVAEALTILVKKRGVGVPVARLVGQAEFWSLRFFVSGDTLVPRPDSELVVEAVLSHLDRDAAHILDVGTGTGCLPLAVLSERSKVTALGVDISPGALATAYKNAKHLSLADRFSTSLSNVYDGVPTRSRYDVILSNPPYIETDVIDDLDAEVREFDPRSALDGGKDGLDIYRPLISNAAQYLLPDGKLIVEIGYDQASSVAALMTETGFRTELLHDLAGHPRVLIGHNCETI